MKDDPVMVRERRLLDLNSVVGDVLQAPRSVAAVPCWTHIRRLGGKLKGEEGGNKYVKPRGTGGDSSYDNPTLYLGQRSFSS